MFGYNTKWLDPSETDMISRPVPDFGEVIRASKAKRCPHARLSVASITWAMFVRSEGSSVALAGETFARISMASKKEI